MSAALSDAIEEFLGSRRARGIAPGTIRQEKIVLRQLLGVTGNILVRNLTGRHIDMYFAAYSHLAPSTWNRNIGYMSGFFAWARARRYAPPLWNPLEGIKRRPTPPAERIYVPVDRFTELLDAARNPRDRALIALGLYGLMRGSETTALTWRDIQDTHHNPTQWRINIIRQKTNTADQLPLAAELQRELARWRFAYGTSVGKPVQPDWYVTPAYHPPQFTHDPNTGRLRKTGDQALNPGRRYAKPHLAIQHALNEIGYKHTTQEGAHTLRRSGGKALYDELAWNRGHDGAIRIVQSMYGHTSVTMTEKYLRLTLEEKRRNDLLAGQEMFPARTGDVTHIAETHDTHHGM